MPNRCADAGCAKRPNFAAPGEARALYCGGHKRAGDVDVVHTRCAAAGCAKRPAFAAPGEARALYCGAHKRAGDDDVVSKRCGAAGCKTLSPRYGVPGTQADHCVAHNSGMIMYPRRRCEKCLELGDWGVSAAAKARRCEAHKAEGDKNLIEGRCASCGFETVRDKVGVCLQCGEFAHTKRQFLVKQKS